MRIKYNIWICTAVLLLIGLILPGLCYGQSKQPVTVVIDAGHGGHDAGAVDNGVNEKDINLGVAKKLARKLEKHGKDIKVVLTRDNDTFISLQERANIANRNRGNLFISIHTNSVDKNNPNRKTVNGASVYALGLNKDGNNLKVAQRENSVIELESDYKQKYSGFDPNKDESYIIFEMAQKRNLGQSLKFADNAQRQLVSTAGRVDRGVKQAGFWVLWATSMPAVLVELDFICNPESAGFLGSNEGQEKLANALYNAVLEYFGDKITSSSVKNNNDNKSVASDRGNNKKSNKNKGKEKGKVSESYEVKPVTVTETTVVDEGVPVLVARTSGDKKPSRTQPSPDNGRSYNYGAVRSGTNKDGRRKRRSESSARISDSRDISAEDIKVKDENSYLAVVETVTIVSEESVPVADDSKNKKKKKNNNKNKKSKNNKKTGKDKGKQKLVINSVGEIVSVGDDYEGNASQLKKHISSTGHRPNTARPVTVYKIQILASEQRLNENNPRFKGLKPIKTFRENNLYKYTYGESSDRAEMEEMLAEVKKSIPDAFIITAMK